LLDACTRLAFSRALWFALLALSTLLPTGPAMTEPAVPAGVPAPAAFVHSARAALARTPEGVDPWFHGYHGELADDRALRTWVRAKRQLLALVGGVRGKVVVDAGSGFGMVANLLASWGAERVWALEVHAPMARSHALVNGVHFPQLAGRVLHVRGDAGRIPLRSGSADIVLSIEAISHYYDVDAFLDECARVLRPGGHVVISDGNNGANPRIRAHTLELWQRFELGPEGTFEGHLVPEPMIRRRERVLRQGFPSLGEARVRELAQVTSGMDRAEITRAVAAHLAGGPAPASPYRHGQCPRDPEWGYVMEQLFDGRELAARLARRGFDARALPHFGGAANDWVYAVNLVLRALPTHRWARAYRVVGRRK
jgi:SAM-dependent methyltransferase